MGGLKSPIVAIFIVEGGSGGALAIGVADSVMMLKYSTYSVISPEGCASILWKDAQKASIAAEAMAITSDRLKELKLIDHIVPEPIGGAHRDRESMARNLKAALIQAVDGLADQPLEPLLDQRYERLMACGDFSGD